MFSEKFDEQIQPDSESFSFGANVFETFIVLGNGRVFMLNEHLERMKATIKELELGDPPDTEDLSIEIRRIAEREENRNRIMRLNYYPDESGEPHYTVAVRNGLDKEIKHKDGIKLLVVNARRNPQSCIVYHKTGNYLENRIAFKQAEKKGFDDALFLNVYGDLAETSKANIFLVKNKVLMTPCIESGILPGIVRAWVLQYAKEQEICTLQITLDASELSDSDEIFITNSVVGIVPVAYIEQEGNLLYSASGDACITARIKEAYIEACRNNTPSSKNGTDKIKPNRPEPKDGAGSKRTKN